MGVKVKVPALDGYELGGTLFEMAGDSNPTSAVVFAGGGGIPASAYRHFAAFLAASGIPVLTFDFRGIGASRPRKLRGFSASVEDWSEFDCGGAINWMRARHPCAELVGIAHSVGTLIIGGAPTIGELGRLVFIGAHTGYYGDYLARHRLPMRLLWHVVMPMLTRRFGYFPARLLRLGEDIPAGVALQWAARRTPELRPEATNPDSSRARGMLARYAEIRVPTLAISFSDDAFATEAGARRLLASYPGLDAGHELIEPGAAGLSKIGHFGFFRRDAEARLWPVVLAYLATRPTELAALPP
jgi:predicted alpha/beta hydrolase